MTLMTDTVTRTRVEWAPVPKVNLLPPEVIEGRRFVRTQRLLAGAVVATVLVSGGTVAWAQSGVTSAREAVEAEQARTRVLQAEQVKYADVPRLLGQVATAETARERALADDSLWYRLLGDLALATPADVSLTSMTVALTHQGGAAAQTGTAGTNTAGTSAAGAATTNPGTGTVTGTGGAGGAAGGSGAAGTSTGPGVGTLTFSGHARAFPDVAAWLESVARLRGLDASTLQTASRDAADGAVSWSSSITVTPDALSHRFDRKVG